MRLWNADGITPSLRCALKQIANYLGFLYCIALPRKIVDIIRAFIYSSSLSRNLICLKCFMNVYEHNDLTEKILIEKNFARVQDR